MPSIADRQPGEVTSDELRAFLEEGHLQSPRLDYKTCPAGHRLRDVGGELAPSWPGRLTDELRRSVLVHNLSGHEEFSPLSLLPKLLAPINLICCSHLVRNIDRQKGAWLKKGFDRLIRKPETGLHRTPPVCA